MMMSESLLQTFIPKNIRLKSLKPTISHFSERVLIGP